MNKFMSMKIWKPKVGDKVYLVNDDTWWTNPRYVTITKVGRQYAYYGDSQLKIDLSDMSLTMTNYGRRGYVFKSEQDYKHSLEQQEMRRYVKEKIHCLTDEQVKIIYDWLTVNTTKE